MADAPLPDTGETPEKDVPLRYDTRLLGRILGETVRAQEGQDLAWVRPNRLKDYPMPPADVPLISHLTTLL